MKTKSKVKTGIKAAPKVKAKRAASVRSRYGQSADGSLHQFASIGRLNQAIKEESLKPITALEVLKLKSTGVKLFNRRHESAVTTVVPAAVKPVQVIERGGVSLEMLSMAIASALQAVAGRSDGNPIILHIPAQGASQAAAH